MLSSLLLFCVVSATLVRIDYWTIFIFYSKIDCKLVLPSYQIGWVNRPKKFYAIDFST